MIVRRTGEWAAARKLLAAMPTQVKPAVRRALLQEAHALRGVIVDGIVAQAPGGAPFQPLAALSIVARKLGGFGGTKALIRRGDLLGAIAVVATDDHIFIGVPRAARTRAGDHLADVAQAHEYGTDPIVIPITPRMRRFLAVLFRAAGRSLPPRGSGKGAVVVQIPPRPFLRPAFAAFQRRFTERVLDRVWRALHGAAS